MIVPEFILKAEGHRRQSQLLESNLQFAKLQRSDWGFDTVDMIANRTMERVCWIERLFRIHEKAYEPAYFVGNCTSGRYIVGQKGT